MFQFQGTSADTADEPTLPPLPSTRQSQGRHRSRDTLILARDSTTSSDPAIFSSDDDPALERYINGTKKRRYVGSWFHQQPALSSDSAIGAEDTENHSRFAQGGHAMKRRKPSHSNRPFKRNLDSGVWMGSDASEESLDAFMPPLPAPRIPVLSLPSNQVDVSSAEREARDKVRDCLEKGQETVDISSLHLTKLSNATIAPLKELFCIPLVVDGVPFQPRDPQIQLYLGNNGLTTLPGAIFDLQNLTLLSLRANELHDLPPAIARLQNLETLNVSQNQLHYLPAEILDLLEPKGHLKDLLVQGNPFLPAETSENLPVTSTSKPEGRIWKSIDSHFKTMEKLFEDAKNQSPEEQAGRGSRLGFVTRFVTQSAIDYRDTVGQPCNVGFSASRTSSPTTAATKVLSLTELSLRACARSPYLSQLGALLPDDSPRALNDLLTEAIVLQEHGGLTCSLCKRDMIIARTRWMEWHEIAIAKTFPSDFIEMFNAHESVVPFLYRGCSWQCIPNEAED